MISSINASSALASMLTQWSRNLVNLMDQDGSSSVSKTEIESLSDADSSTIDALFSNVDSDSNEAITQQEFASALAKMFQEMQNESTNTSANTGMPPPPPESGDMFSSLDTDTDGYLTVEEMTAGGVADAETIFSEIDTDGDGKVSQAESDAFDEKMRANGPQGMASAPPPPPPESGDMFSSLDTDTDGYLTVEEMTAGGVADAETIFSEIDTDGDGKVSQAESDAFDETMKANASKSETTIADAENKTSLQMEYYNRLIEMITQSGGYADYLTTKSTSILA